MSEGLHLLPHSVRSAAENMAVDLLMLEGYPEPDQPRFRAYHWTDPNAVTFGLSQRIEEILQQVAGETTEPIRRPTGGGLVRHAHSWTFALVVPPLLADQFGDAIGLYEAVHRNISEVLRESGIETSLAELPSERNSTPALACFPAASPYDVISSYGSKIAGAAQKRTRQGILMQGSIAPNPETFPTENDFWKSLTRKLAYTFQTDVTPAPFPVWESLSKKTEHFRSEAWNRRR